MDTKVMKKNFKIFAYLVQQFLRDRDLAPASEKFLPNPGV